MPTIRPGCIIAFNNTTTEIWTGDGPDKIAVDISGSIRGKNELLVRTVLAELIQGTSAEGKVDLPELGGPTAICDAVAYCQSTAKDGDLYLITDGHENCKIGVLPVGTQPDGSEKQALVDFTAHTDSKILAQYLEHLGVHVCIVGIGDDAKRMVTEMLGRKNVFCGHIDHTADIKSIISVVRTLKRMPTGRAGRSTTRNGVQHAVLLAMHEDVQATLQELTSTDVSQLQQVIGRTKIAGGAIACPADLQQAIDDVLAVYDENITGHEATVKAALLLGMEAMCHSPLPAAMISSKHSAIMGMPASWPAFRRHCNRLFSQLASANLLQREDPVSDDGLTLESAGRFHVFSAGCAQYSCRVPLEIVKQLALDTTYCTPRAALPAPKRTKRKRPASSLSTATKKLCLT